MIHLSTLIAPLLHRNVPIIAIAPARMMNIARLLYFDARYAAPQMETAAKAFGGTVILEDK